MQSLTFAAFAKDPFSLVLVDKKTNRVHLAQYATGRIELVKSYHATLGKALGDKSIKDDKRTPEGVYFITSKLTPPQLQKKFGVMAFPVDYPNPMDRLQRKTGFGIMLHATDDPTRLAKDYDSEGCVVVDNKEIAEIAPRIRLGLTPLIVYNDLKSDYLAEDYEPGLKSFFQAWTQAWANKDIDKYIAAYDSEFYGKGMGVKEYKRYKDSLNKKYHKIDVKVFNVKFFYHPKYDVVYFTQNYRAWDKAGRKIFDSYGTKFLYVRHDSTDHRIIFEDFNHVAED